MPLQSCRGESRIGSLNPICAKKTGSQSHGLRPGSSLSPLSDYFLGADPAGEPAGDPAGEPGGEPFVAAGDPAGEPFVAAGDPAGEPFAFAGGGALRQ